VSASRFDRRVYLASHPVLFAVLALTRRWPSLRLGRTVLVHSTSAYVDALTRVPLDRTAPGTTGGAARAVDAASLLFDQSGTDHRTARRDVASSLGSAGTAALRPTWQAVLTHHLSPPSAAFAAPEALAASWVPIEVVGLAAEMAGATAAAMLGSAVDPVALADAARAAAAATARAHLPGIRRPGATARARRAAGALAALLASGMPADDDGGARTRRPDDDPTLSTRRPTGSSGAARARQPELPVGAAARGRTVDGDAKTGIDGAGAGRAGTDGAGAKGAGADGASADCAAIRTGPTVDNDARTSTGPARAARPVDNDREGLVARDNGMAAMLAVAAINTTVAALPRAAAWCAKAGWWDRALDPDPDARLAFAAELLRLTAPTPVLPRVAAGPGRVGGCPVRGGDRLLLVARHAARAHEPARAVPPQTANLVFGVGPHACPGAALARAQLADALAALAVHHPVVGRAKADRRSALPGWRELWLHPTPRPEATTRATPTTTGRVRSGGGRIARGAARTTARLARIAARVVRTAAHAVRTAARLDQIAARLARATAHAVRTAAHTVPSAARLDQIAARLARATAHAVRTAAHAVRTAAQAVPSAARVVRAGKRSGGR